MKIGDKVRFLNDVGGGKISAFRQGGIVLVEDEDGFDVPVHESEIVVIETNANNFVKKEKPKPRVEYGAEPELKDGVRMSGKDYLKEKSQPVEKGEVDSDVDENLEARVVRLEMTVRKLQMQLERLMDDKVAREKQRVEAKQARKAAKDEIIEVDLHSHELLETTAGMDAADIKQYQLGVFRKTMDEHLKEKGRRIVFIHGKGDGVLRAAIISELKYRYKSCDYQDASFQQYGFGATMVIVH